MSRAIPETKASELFERIQRMDAYRCSEFEFERLKRDATKLLDIDAHHAYMALGAIAALRLEVPEIHSNFKAALGLDESEVTFHNYATALTKAAEFREALPLFRKAHKLVPEDLTALSDYIQCAIHAGDPELASQLLPEWDRRSPNEPYVFQDSIQETKALLIEKDIAPARLMQLHQLAFDVMRSAKFGYEALSFGVVDDGSASIYDLDVALQGAEAKDIVDLNLRLLQVLTNQDFDTYPEALSISFSSAQ